MKTNKILPTPSINKVWENFRKMNGIVLTIPSSSWIENEEGFTNTVYYDGFTADEILEVDLYDDGTLTETQISEYDGYITEFNVEDGKIVAIATTKPTQTIKIFARGEIVGKLLSSNISASNVSCLDKDGLASNVQKELDEHLNMRYNPNTDKVEIFYDGQWNEWKSGNMQTLYIYNGENLTEFNGIFEDYKGTISKVEYSSYIAFTFPTYNNGHTMMGAIVPITIPKDKSKLCLKYTLTGYNFLFGIASSKITGTLDFTKSIQLSAASNITTVELDVSDYAGMDYYVVFAGSNNANFNLYALWI